MERQSVNVKKKKKNPLVPLLALLAVMAVLWIAYAAVKVANEKKAEAERLAAEEAQKTVTISALDPAGITELSYEAEGYTDGALTFVVSDGAWQWKDDAAFPLDQTRLSAMGTAVTSIEGIRELQADAIEGGLAACGLDEPSCTVTVTGADGKHVFRCGDYNGTYKAYYLMADERLYLTETDLAYTFEKGLTDLLARDSLPVSDWSNREMVNSVVLRNGGEEREITDADELDTYLTSLSSVYLSEYADYSADEGEKASYGLDGSRSVTVNYRKSVAATDASGNSVTNYLDTSYVFLIGNAYEEDESLTAVCPASSAVVYLIDTEKAEGLLG